MSEGLGMISWSSLASTTSMETATGRLCKVKGTPHAEFFCLSSSNANHIRTRWIIVCVSGEKSLSNRSNMRMYVAGKSGGSVLRAFLLSLSFGNLKRKSSWHLTHWNLECTVNLDISLAPWGLHLTFL